LVGASLVRSRAAAAAPAGITPVFIRWDAWYSQDPPARWAQDALGPRQWQFRAPWFASVVAPDHIEASGGQAEMDLEIDAAAAAGIKAWAFNWYVPAAGGPPGAPAMARGWQLYRSSRRRSKVRWCALAAPGYLGALPWSNGDARRAAIDAWLGYFGEPDYLTCLGGRPVLFILWSDADVATYFDAAPRNVARALADLRSRCAAARIGDPYVVVMNGGAATAAATMRAIGADAISAYIPALRLTETPSPAATLDAQAEAFRRSLVDTGAPVVPNAITGWDTRPRRMTPVPWEHGRRPSDLDRYVAAASPDEVALHLRRAVRFIGENARSCPSRLMLVYSWNECDEGGNVAMPTLGDPPVGNPPTTRMLTAIGPALRAGP
jgi:hypothetical protein